MISAVNDGDVEFAMELIKAGADVNYKNEVGARSVGNVRIASCGISMYHHVLVGWDPFAFIPQGWKYGNCNGADQSWRKCQPQR